MSSAAMWERFRVRFSVLGSRFSVANALLVFEFESGFILFDKFAELLGGLEQAGPLFVIKCHGETPEAVYAHTSLFADPEFQASGAFRALLFQFRQAGFQFFISWFGHELT